MTSEPENPTPSPARADGDGGEAAPPRRRTLAEEIIAREIAARAAASASGQSASKPAGPIKATAVFRPIRFVKPAVEKPPAPPQPSAPTTIATPVPTEEPKASATAPALPTAVPTEEKLPPPTPPSAAKRESVVAPPSLPVQAPTGSVNPTTNTPSVVPKATKVSMVFRPKAGAGLPPPPPPPAPVAVPSVVAPAADAEAPVKSDEEAAPIPAASESVAVSDADGHAAETTANDSASESSVAAAHRILVAARRGAAAEESRGAKRAAEGVEPASNDAGTPASEAVTNPSGWPAVVRACAMVFRRSAIALIILGGGYYAARTWVIPMINELQHPGKTDAIHDKAAPTAVRVLQQTRQVVAQNDARVEYLNSVVDQVDGKARQPAPPPTPPPAAAPAVVAAPAPVVLPADAYREAVDRLKIAGVYAGEDPRINLDGRLVKFGEIVDRDLGLRFIGIDPVEHVILFSNADNVTFKKIY